MRKFSYTIGVIIALGAIIGSIIHLNQPLIAYWDAVAMMMVFGGTIAVTVITLPMQNIQELWHGIKIMWWPEEYDQKEIVKKSLDLIGSRKFDNVKNLGLTGLPMAVATEGAELLTLGFDPEKIEEILHSRIESNGRRRKKMANSIKGIAKYPPAFGLMGTVLGLVNLMRELSSGANAQQTGMQMSVALVATLYGLLISNLVIYPAGEAILQKAVEEQDNAELVVQAMVLAAKNVSVLEAQEYLNAMVDPKDRINVLANFMADEVA